MQGKRVFGNWHLAEGFPNPSTDDGSIYGWWFMILKEEHKNNRVMMKYVFRKGFSSTVNLNVLRLFFMYIRDYLCNMISVVLPPIVPSICFFSVFCGEKRWALFLSLYQSSAFATSHLVWNQFSIQNDLRASSGKELHFHADPKSQFSWKGSELNGPSLWFEIFRNHCS